MKAPRRLIDVLNDLGLSSAAVDTAVAEFYAPRRLGEYLVERGLLTPAQLEVALIRQSAMRRQRLGTLDSQRLLELWTTCLDNQRDACNTILKG